MLIEGRLAEDFKLSSGVWVNVSGLRAQLLEGFGPIVRDVVISGPHRDELAALIFLDPEQCRRLTGDAGEWLELSRHELIQAQVQAAIDRHNADNGASSRRIVRQLILTRPLDPAAGELTEKGTVNQRVVLAREAAACDALHAAVAATAS